MTWRKTNLKLGEQEILLRELGVLCMASTGTLVSVGHSLYRPLEWP